MKKYVACLFLLTLPSCFLGRTAVNEPLDPATVHGIKPGMAATEVVEKMGAPDEVVQLGQRTAYRYSYTVEKGTGTFLILIGLYNEDSRRDIVWVFFDPEQRVSHVGSTFHSHRTGFHMLPWTDIHSPEAARADDSARGL